MFVMSASRITKILCSTHRTPPSRYWKGTASLMETENLDQSGMVFWEVLAVREAAGCIQCLYMLLTPFSDKQNDGSDPVPT